MKDPQTLKHLARTLRKGQTEAERRLWSWLRARQMEGGKFRRQQPVGPYIVDFVTLEPRLVVEVDGSQHLERATDDEIRSRYLRGLGYRVLRFWNHEVLADTEAVLEAIRLAVVEPSPSGQEPPA